MIWVVFAIALALVLVLYRRMLKGISVFVPARTHLAGWRGVAAADGSDTWVFLAFAVAFFALLALDWRLAVAWLAAVFGGMEILRRSHNNRSASM